MIRMLRRLPAIALAVFATGFVTIIILAGQGRGFWGFLQEIPGGDKLGHVGLVGTLALLLNLTLRNRRFGPPFHWLQIGSGLVAFVMTLEEASQLLLPARSPDLLDWLANLTGAALGQCISSMIPLIRSRRGVEKLPRID